MEDDKSQSAPSRRSLASSKSAVSMAATKARAKAEAAQARASFAKKEMEIKIEKARLEATLDVIDKEREAEAAMAEAAVMEAAVADLEMKKSSHSASIHLPQESSRQRTEEYVKQHSELSNTVSTRGNSKSELAQNLEDDRGKKSPAPVYHVLSSWKASQYSGSEKEDQCHDAATLDLAKFLARNQLVTSGLNKFDDRPENYLAWKSSFLNAIKNLDLSAGEEFDLLIRWLGRESADHARRIKSVNVRNLPAGLELIWERLDMTYGSPEAIEKALFTKIETFPKISAKDHHNLQELGDLLLKIEAAKSGGDLPGLTYLDTARGVNPIVQKLPFGLQEKWMMQGSSPVVEMCHQNAPGFAAKGLVRSHVLKYALDLCSIYLKTCAGVVEASGRRAHGFIIESADGEISFPLPTLIECNSMPDNRDEIPTAVAALHHSHLKAIADKIPPIDPNAEILLLLGRDIIRAHKVRRQLNGPHDAPYAQKLDLGWVIVGNVCLGKCHKPSTVNCMRTHILENGRPSYFSPCNNHIVLKEMFNEKTQFRKPSSLSSCRLQSVFQQTKDDNKFAPSVEDVLFLDMMEKEFSKDSSNSWVAPLPFREPRRRLPNNREYAVKRFKSLRRNLDRRPKMRDDFTEFMQRILDNNHAELAPPLRDGQECWYLPSFGVYHPKKPEQIRVVFDSSAEFDGISLNDVLLSGPDLNNSLLGVLLRFRKDPVAITADIEQMFHYFLVREDCRDVLRFLWHRDNDLTKEVVDYRMRVHVFGNRPSPAVAIYGIRRAAREEEKEYGSDVRKFIEQDFYVDDALRSFPTEEEAIDLLKRAQEALAISNLRLHKIAANKAKVMDAFPNEDLAKDIKYLDLSTDDLPDQRSLGVQWNLMLDTFTIQVPNTEKPYTRRGVLSTVNSLFDPLGFLAPITIQGRLLLRELSLETQEWDTPLPENRHEEWTRWCNSLQNLRSLNIPRMYISIPLSEAEHTEICVFSDASMKAISAVAYLRASDQKGNTEVGFILGKARLAPKPNLSVPRLELCAAVLAVEMSELITEEINIKPDNIRFYTDRYTQLTHEVLVTFMSEVTAIINARPLVPVSTDPEFPFILTPSMLLTQKAGNLPTPPEDFSKKDMLQCQ
ncbi:hypothetical protein QQF64_002759 [Cirrhinus molitorella]|uniref:Reverse transcriptase/retrotransposon-derived protein RNase H-like domain-containing protein n=1 Tax=Cirrhinus molitorella TaxID=172907 RepID=A0ABR3MR27_9TELE